MEDGNGKGDGEQDGKRRLPPPLRPRIRSGLSAPRRSLHGDSSRSVQNSSTPRLSAKPSLLSKKPNPATAGKNFKPLQKSTRGRQVPKSVVQPVSGNDESLYFRVLYTKRSKKKHKVYQDGYLMVQNDRKVDLMNEDGKKISSAKFGKPMGGLKEGNTLEIGTFELEVQSLVSAEDYTSGRLFLSNSVANTAASSASGSIRVRQKPLSKFKPLRSKNATKTKTKAEVAAPLHDPTAPNAVVLQSSYAIPNGKQSVPIVLDPYLGRKMRPHQIQGVQFLFNCVQGAAERGESNGSGAILADSMGLGKSLQSIALLWTLLKQGSMGRPFASKAIIVCPASLVQNWVDEVKKWLGLERLKPVALMSGNSSFGLRQSLADFLHGGVSQLLIISYEMFRSHANDLYKVDCGILICDEGHRLKASGGNKTIAALNKSPCRRRIILTGTPVQNDLEEFFAMCNFVNPGVLGSLPAFRTVFANPIIASRDTITSPEAVALGQARGTELHKQTAKFVLRRTSKLLEKYLPLKNETAVFCHLSEEQAEMYSDECDQFVSSVGDFSNTAEALRVINRLRKVCSHPDLLKDEEETDETEGSNFLASSKMSVAMSICTSSIDVGDRLVIVSNFTSTLDVLEEALDHFKISFCRLDGSTPAQNRGDLVRRFNNGHNEDKVFLLSAKAGGVGLNIIGANRLILFDPDWNPATDLQAMARVWRDGQTKHVFVYRLLCTGTIEEKIFQRQLFKGELQIAIEAADGNDEISFAKGGGGKQSSGINFSASELRNLFRYGGNKTELCDTLRVLERSREDAHRGNEEGDEVDMKSELLNAFARYRSRIESLAPVTGVVPCQEDEVLSTALNVSEDTAGIVSYLYTTHSGVSRASKRKTSPVKESKSLPKKKVARKIAIVQEDESGDHDSSDSDIGFDKNPAVTKAMQEMKMRHREKTAVLAVKSASNVPGNDSVMEGSSSNGDKGRPAVLNGIVASFEATGDEKTGAMEKENAVPASSLTWEDALDVIDVDGDDGENGGF